MPLCHGVLSQSHPVQISENQVQHNRKHSLGTLGVPTVLTIWFALVLLLGSAGAFVRAPGTPPLPKVVPRYDS